MAYPAGLEASLRRALEEALRTPDVQATLADAGVNPCDVREFTVSHAMLGEDTVRVSLVPARSVKHRPHSFDD